MNSTMETYSSSPSSFTPNTKSVEQTIESLAKQILESCGVLSDLPKKWFINDEQSNDGHDISSKVLPYLTSLEKVLEIESSFRGISINGDDAVKAVTKNENECTDENKKLLTCTDFRSNMFHSVNPVAGINSVSTNTTDRDLDQYEGTDSNPQYWSPSIQTSDQYQDEQKEHQNLDTNFIIPSLEDYTPFKKEFHMSIGKLMSFVYSQMSSNYNQNLQLKTSDEIKTKNEKYHQSEVRKSEIIEQYTLGQDVYSVRMTKILFALMQLDLGNYEVIIGGHDDCTSTSSRKRKQGENDSVEQDDSQHNLLSFIDLFLFHVERNTRCEINTVVDNKFSSPKTSIPFIQSLFKHYATLPQLESHVHTVLRKYKAIPTSGMDAKIEHMKKTQIIQERLEKELQSHISSLEGIIGTIYSKCDSDLRMKMRLRIGHILHTFVMQSSSGGGRYSSGGGIGGMGIENTSGAGIDSLLKVLHRILQGVQMKIEQQDNENNDDHNSKVGASCEHLLMNVLLPLHKPSGMVLWRDQTPILGLYHVSLVQCIGVLARLDGSFVGAVIRYLIHPDVWPLEGGRGKGSAANTPKVVLLLHEIDTLIGLLKIPTHFGDEQLPSDETLSETIVPLVTRLAASISSDNSRTSERALEFFKNEKFKSIVKLHLSKVMATLLQGLCRIDSGMDIPWNPTVRKMTLLVLQELECYDNDIFNEACLLISKRRQTKVDDKDRKVKEQQVNSIEIKSHDESPSTEDISLKKSMGKWKPPQKYLPLNSTSARHTGISNSNGKTSAPPLNITGVAPWSVKSFPKTNKKNQPPLTVTGVAPWAVKKTPQSFKRFNQPKASAPLPNKIGHLNKEGDSDNAKTNSDISKTNYDPRAVSKRWFQSYVDKLKESQKDDDPNKNPDGVSEWSKTQMAESPLLLPTLKFHDLVFGQVLGTGSFSTVKYARQILKGKTRSHWPEFAVKVVSTEKIEELGYEHSINREIAILQKLSHPGIARLVSSFRFREGAYLVLEYGSGGDLHSLLKQNGSLDEKSTRFVVGELVAALHSIHEMGMVYVDLKPENILVTEIGHVKITDFGGCRPLTEEARQMVKQTGSNLLNQLRDGDWRDSENYFQPNKEAVKREGVEDDIRIEGTTAYLPPEVILGGYPTFATDSWALGCVFYQCLAGKPPLLDISESRTKQKIVTFNSDLSTSNDLDIFSAKGSGNFSDTSTDLIKKLLSHNPTDRPNMVSISEHDFFNDMDVFSLFKRASSTLVAGRIKPQPNAAWTRRQFSSIWAPQPQAYNLSSNEEVSISSTFSADGPILEGAESTGLFLTKISNRRPKLVGITEKM